MQVDQTKTPGTSTGQRPEPLVGTQQEPPRGLGSRVKRFFLGDKMDAERLKALGEAPIPLSGTYVSMNSYLLKQHHLMNISIALLSCLPL